MSRLLPLQLIVFLLLTGVCAARSHSSKEAEAMAGITADRLTKHIAVLASDNFEGRAPGTPGEEKTIQYLVSQFTQMGLLPGNPDGSYIQDVPLVGFTARPAISFTAGAQKIDFKFPNDAVVWSRHFQPQATVSDNPVIFVGYGVVAPEYGWKILAIVSARNMSLTTITR